MRGYNYGEYSESVSPYKIDERILSTATKGLDGTTKYIPNGSKFCISQYSCNENVIILML